MAVRETVDSDYEDQTLSPEQFIMLGMRKVLERDLAYDFVHPVYSGLYKAYRKYFKLKGMAVAEPRDTVDKLVAQSILFVAPAKGGCHIWFMEDVPEHKVRPDKNVTDLIQRMGLAQQVIDAQKE